MSLVLEKEVVMDLLRYFLRSKTVTLGTSLFCSLKWTTGAWYKFKGFILMRMLLDSMNTLFSMPSAWQGINKYSWFKLPERWGIREDYFYPLFSDSLKTVLTLFVPPTPCSSSNPNRDRFEVLLGGLRRWWGVSFGDVITLLISSVLN